jgi:hypothetical protein
MNKEIIKNLDNVIKKYENKNYLTGELRIDLMAKECKMAIECLQQDLEKKSKILNELKRYLIDSFNKTQDTKYLDDIMKLEELEKSDSCE